MSESHSVVETIHKSQILDTNLIFACFDPSKKSGVLHDSMFSSQMSNSISQNMFLQTIQTILTVGKHLILINKWQSNYGFFGTLDFWGYCEHGLILLSWILTRWPLVGSSRKGFCFRIGDPIILKKLQFCSHLIWVDTLDTNPTLKLH